MCNETSDDIKVMSAGAATGTAGSIGAVSAMGTVAGLSATGITSGLAAIGALVGGGMVAGVCVVASAPVIVGGTAYGLYKANQD
jgi:hypothetical protein